MDLTLLNRKKLELEQWLQQNPNHPNRIEVESDLRNLKDELKTHEANAPTGD